MTHVGVGSVRVEYVRSEYVHIQLTFILGMTNGISVTLVAPGRAGGRVSGGGGSAGRGRVPGTEAV